MYFSPASTTIKIERWPAHFRRAHGERLHGGLRDPAAERGTGCARERDHCENTGKASYRESDRAGCHADAPAQKSAGVDKAGALSSLGRRQRRECQARGQRVGNCQTAAYHKEADGEKAHVGCCDCRTGKKTGKYDERHSARHRIAKPRSR